MVTKIMPVQPINLLYRDQQRGGEFSKRKETGKFKESLDMAKKKMVSNV